MTQGDWDALRNQERDLKAELSKERLGQPAPEPYTWFPGDVTIDGVITKKVGLRKRGFVGSADKDRPGLNIELDKYVKGQRFAGRSEFKLHNNKQDASNVRQALAYRTFAAAGVPAPRCNLATVSVNGKNLGVYSNLEGIDSDFLARHFGSEKGNLYEAQVSDFRPGWTASFQKKNNKKNSSRAELEAVAKALEADDAQLLAELSRVVDIDAFISFWAVESLLNHWDGFTGHLNNSFVYHDPKSGRMRFIPWGTDGTFGSQHIFAPFEPPVSVWAVSILPRRLYNHPETQQKYRARMQELLATVWKESEMLDEIARMQTLTKGLSTISPFVAMPQVNQLKQFIQNRRGEIEAELKQPPTPWTFPGRREPWSASIGEVSAEFSGEWVSSVFVPAPAGAKAQVTLDFYGRRYVGEFTDVKAAPDLMNPKNAAVMLTGKFEGVNIPVSIWYTISTNQFESGKALPMTGPESGLALVAGQIGKKDWRWLGSSESGSMRFEEATRKSGTKVKGRVQAKISNLPWDDFNLAELKPAP